MGGSTARTVTAPLLGRDEFRALFPALDEWAWLDTPGSPPGARPVLEAVRGALDDWESGRFSWLAWDATVEAARAAFADYTGVAASRVAVMGSVAEAVSTVAAALPAGSIVVGENEYRSVLFPLLALGPDHPVIRVPESDGVVTAELLAEAIRPDTVLVAVSDTLTSNGNPVDLAVLRRATDAIGVRMLVDLTQSLGVLHRNLDALDADFTVVHGYKWLLCPRGAAWLVARTDRLAELRPLLPSWKSTDPPHGYFGGTLALPETGSRLDTSPAWFSWIGAVAALDVLARLDPDDVRSHCVEVAARWHTIAIDLGLRPVLPRQESHIVVVEADEEFAEELPEHLASARVKASVTGRRLRVGVHYFTDDDDIDRLADAVRSARRSAGPH